MKKAEIVICHQCEQPKPRSGCSVARIWVGIIDAVKEDHLLCFDCLAERRRESEESSSWEVEGEDWKGTFNPDDENGEEWKDAK